MRKDNKFGDVTAKHKFKNDRRRTMKIEVSVKMEDNRHPVVKKSEEKFENGKKSSKRGKWKARKILSGAEGQDDQRASKLLPFGIDTGTRISRPEFKSIQGRIQKRLDAVTNLNLEWETCRNMCTSITHNLDVAIKELTEIRQRQRDYGHAYKYIFKGVVPPRNTFQACKLQMSERLSKTFKCCNPKDTQKELNIAIREALPRG